MKFDLSHANHPAFKSRPHVPLPVAGGDYRGSLVPEAGGRSSQNDEMIKAENSEPSLALHLLVAMNLGMRNTICSESMDTASRFLYACTLVICVGLGITFIFKNNIISFTDMDWFGWLTWAVLILVELMLVLTRLLARWSFTGSAWDRRHLNGRGGRINAMWKMIMKRDAFGNCGQAFVVCTLQLAASAFSLIGALAIVSRLLLHRAESQRDMAAIWTVIFVFVVFSLVIAGVTDTVRVKEIDAQGGWRWALEFQAWRLVLLVFVLPIVSIAYIIYVHVCCSGDWLW